jgi:hypothetical protein
MKTKVKVTTKKKVVAKKPTVKKPTTVSKAKSAPKKYKNGGLTTEKEAGKTQRAKEKYYNERRYMHEKTPGPQTEEDYLKSVDKQFGNFRTPGPREETTMERQERQMRNGHPVLRTRRAKPVDDPKPKLELAKDDRFSMYNTPKQAIKKVKMKHKSGGVKKVAPKKYKTGGVKKTAPKKRK